MKKIGYGGLVVVLLVSVMGFVYALLRPSPPSDHHTLRVGVTAGPHAIIMEQVKIEAKKHGLNLKIIEFNDFMLPNAALAQGDIDVNSYQHQPFLEEQVKALGYPLKGIAKTVLMPMAVYSRSVKTIQEIPDHSVITIPNDPTNGGRALLLLAQLGLIRLKNVSNPKVVDITENPKHLIIKELDAPSLPITLEDAAAAVINTDWVFLAGIDPDIAIAAETANSPYANIIAVRQGHEQDNRIQTFIKIYQSPEIKDFIAHTFKGSVIPAW